MSILLFSLAISLLLATTIANRTITVVSNCTGTQYLHYAYSDESSETLQTGLVAMDNGDSFAPSFVGTFGGWFWMNTEDCDPFNGLCTEGYGTNADFQLYSEIFGDETTYSVSLDDNLPAFTIPILIQSWPDANDCPKAYAQQLENGTVIGANTDVYCPSGNSYQVTMCGSDGN